VSDTPDPTRDRLPAGDAQQALGRALDELDAGYPFAGAAWAQVGIVHPLLDLAAAVRERRP
jgi:hypothetical protein